MTADALRQARERIVREHMQSENDLDFERTLATFKHPRYELYGNGVIFDGPEQVSQYYWNSRAAFPDQRNDII